jgi:mannosylglycerate hydrolase
MPLEERGSIMAVQEPSATESKPGADTGEGLSVYYHTHWDREWYLPFRAFQVRLAEVVDEVLERLETGALPCFMLDGQTVVLEDYLELRPENRERMKALIESGKLSIGPWYVAPDEFLVSGESLIRNLQRGIRQAREWGCNQFTGYLPDTFGHSADMPTIFGGFGIDSAIVWRGLNPKHSILNWQSPSGATVKTLHLTDGYFQMMLDDWTLTPEQRLEALDNLVRRIRAASPPSSKEKIGLLPMGADHMGPLPGEAREILMARYPKLTETTPEKFMGALPDLPGLETVTGELMDNSAAFLLPGVWSSRMYLKQANRRLEHLLTRKLEPLLALTQAFLQPGSFRYPTHELDLAWKLLLLNHPHDSICGCSVDEVHRENEQRFEQVEQIVNALIVRAEHALSALGGEDEWVIINTGDQPFTGVVHVLEDVPDGETPPRMSQIYGSETLLQDNYLFDCHQIPLSHLTKKQYQGFIWVEDVPANGLKILSKKERAPYQPVFVENNQLENEWLSVTVESDGTLTILEKKTGKIHRKFLQIRDLADQGDSYNSDPIPQSSPVFAEFINSEMCLIGRQSHDLLMGELRLNYAFPDESASAPGKSFWAQLYLSSGVPELRIVICKDALARLWHPNDAASKKIQVLFPTDEPIRSVVTETHLGTVKRSYEPGYSELDSIPAQSMKELKTNTGPIQTFISTNGQTWLTEGLTEYEVVGNVLALTMMRGFRYLSKRQLGTRGAPAGPPMWVADDCYRNMSFQLAWMPTPDEPAKLYEAAGRFYGNVWGTSGTGAKKFSDANSLVSWDNPALVSSACYWLPNRGLVLRLINTTDRELSTNFTVGFKYHAIHETNMLEEIQRTLSDAMGAGDTVIIGPRDVKTLLFALPPQTGV